MAERNLDRSVSDISPRRIVDFVHNTEVADANAPETSGAFQLGTSGSPEGSSARNERR